MNGSDTKKTVLNLTSADSVVYFTIAFKTLPGTSGGPARRYTLGRVMHFSCDTPLFSLYTAPPQLTTKS
jgi:hypothetical protein